MREAMSVKEGGLVKELCPAGVSGMCPGKSLHLINMEKKNHSREGKKIFGRTHTNWQVQTCNKARDTSIATQWNISLYKAYLQLYIHILACPDSLLTGAVDVVWSDWPVPFCLYCRKNQVVIGVWLDTDACLQALLRGLCWPAALGAHGH